MTTRPPLTFALASAIFFAGPVMGQGVDPSAVPSNIQITRNGTRPTVSAPPNRIIGTAIIDPLFSPNDTISRGASKVVFAPNARTAWHTHPRGQIMIVVDGTGWIQEWGGKQIEVKPGDVVWFSPNVKHWHGATDKTSMTSIEIQDVVDGKSSDWPEAVTDEEFLK
jgi:quercetin dioxygenase-like cupin family protein